MGAGASALPVEQLTDPAEITLYKKLQARYDAEIGECATEEAKHELVTSLRKEYDDRVLSTTMLDHAAITVGDVVQAPVEGLFYEGVVNSIDGMFCTVDFGDDDCQQVLLDVCRRVLAWHTIEVNDEVKVRDTQSDLEFVGHVTGVTSGPMGPVYEVKYDQDDEAGEVEKHISPDRIRKLKSARSSAMKRWHKAYTVIVAAHAFEAAGKKEPDGALDPDYGGAKYARGADAARAERKEAPEASPEAKGPAGGAGGVLPNADGLDPDYSGAKFARGAQAARQHHDADAAPAGEAKADATVVYADDGGLDPDFSGAKYARGAQAAGAMPEE